MPTDNSKITTKGTMLTFTPCTPQTCRPLRTISGLITPQGCDTSIINLCSWQHLYQGSIAICNDNIILRFSYEGHRAYSLRFRPADLADLLQVVREDAAEAGDGLSCPTTSRPTPASAAPTLTTAPTMSMPARALPPSQAISCRASAISSTASAAATPTISLSPSTPMTWRPAWPSTSRG